MRTTADTSITFIVYSQRIDGRESILWLLEKYNMPNKWLRVPLKGWSSCH